MSDLNYRTHRGKRPDRQVNFLAEESENERGNQSSFDLR